MATMTQSNDDLTMRYLIDEHCASLVLTHSERTITERRRCLYRLDAHLPGGITRGTPPLIRTWLANPDWSRWTRYTYCGHIVEAYRWLHANGWLLADPTVGIKRPPQPQGVPRPAREEHIAILLQAAEPLPTIALLGGWAGLRTAEIAAARREHVSEQLIYIPNAKGGDPQTVPCHPLIWRHVRDLPDGPLITGRRGRPLSTAALGLVWRRARRQLGLPDDLVPHQLRHRFGTQVRRKHDVLVAKRALRHKRLSSTEVYAEVTDDEVAHAIRDGLPSGPPEPAVTRLGQPQAA